MRDIKAIKANINIVDVIRKRLHLKKQGREHVGLCPFHKDTKPSLMVNEKKQIFSCFACGETGDVLDFLVKYGLTFKEALDEMEGLSNTNLGNPAKIKLIKSKKKQVSWKPILPAPEPGNIVHYKYGKPHQKWRYHDKNGKLMFLICRFNLPNGKKEIYPYTYCTDGKRRSWRWQALPKPRPLYNQHLIQRHPNKTVLVVEGEKTADAAQKLFPHVVVTTWPGGARAIRMINWSPLKGRKVILWPDNDISQCYGDKHPMAGKVKPFHEQPGNAAMIEIGSIIKVFTKVLKWIENSKDFPDKWDVADQKEWTPADAKDYAKKHLIDVPFPVKALAPPKVKKTAAGSTPSDEKPNPKPKPSTKRLDEYKNYFQFLGYMKEGQRVNYAFFVKETKVIQSFNVGSLAKMSTLISLAPMDFWEDNFIRGSRKKVNTEIVINWMCRVSHNTGFFSMDKLRGRGAWLDDGRTVFHAGDHLIVNGKKRSLNDFNSKFIYEAGPPLDIDMTNPLETSEAHKIIEMTKLLNWDREVNAYILAGWSVVSILCGALTWRSHIWLTGAAGTGKSWVFNKTIRALLGKICYAVQSKTTEPGIRQLLKSDAIPIIFDEAEGEDQRALARMEDVIGLMRAASSDDGGIIAMGTSGGGGMKYKIRSCFAFASIGLVAHHNSDRTRITVLSLKSVDAAIKKNRFEKLLKIYSEAFSDDFASRLQARTISLMPVILENARIFSAAAATVLGDQRKGDQIGPLIAGAYSLSSKNVITLEKAKEWLEGHNWEEESELDDSKDEFRLLNFLLEQMIRIDGGGKHTERTVGELIMIAGKYERDAVINGDVAHNRLKRMGIKITYLDDSEDADPILLFSNTSTHIKKMLRFSPWAHNHHKILLRLPDAFAMPPTRFSPGSTARSTGMPLFNLFEKLEKIKDEDTDGRNQEGQHEDASKGTEPDEEIPF